MIAPSLHPLWAGTSAITAMYGSTGTAMHGGGMAMGGSATKTALESLGYHYGTGVVIAVLATFALGLLAARHSDALGAADRSGPVAATREPRMVDV